MKYYLQIGFTSDIHVDAMLKWFPLELVWAGHSTCLYNVKILCGIEVAVELLRKCHEMENFHDFYLTAEEVL